MTGIPCSVDLVSSELRLRRKQENHHHQSQQDAEYALFQTGLECGELAVEDLTCFLFGSLLLYILLGVLERL